ncbi:MAG: bifunctional 5,10-methylenetetrahydrofolate dehydrogenase/5,10-methenyltetrahydrofolate cyclohydrolase [Bacteroidales bacterium]|nr:bifunctional 5,10-methylenetetrahydrofolate dehydrogenase/5,10-methenyltetrahydrofolate cyclohydrolase [Bacteroidales bacterium]
MVLLDGKEVSRQIRAQIALEVSGLIGNGKRAPHLAAVLVGDDPASQTYVSNKEKACREVGFLFSVYRLPDSTTGEELTEVVDFINKDNEVDGLIVQLPLPPHISPTRIIEAIDPSKDVDGYHPLNFGRMALNLPSFLPATPLGILKILEHYRIETDGKSCVVIGRSQTVGTPVSLLLSRKSTPGNCTVTICHSRSHNLVEISSGADILIVAAGRPEMVGADMVKEGSVVIDVGIHRLTDANTKKGYRITGDVKFDKVAPRTSHITPVPGGVGPMTVVSLLLNTLKAYKKEVYC